MAEWLDFLATLPIFSFFTRAELTAAQELFEEAWFGKDEVICRIGDEGDRFYVVLAGELEVWAGGDPPRQTGTLGPADFFGEMALLQGGKRSATVKVSRRARLLSLDKHAFDALFLKNPKAIEYFARVLSKRLASVTRGERAHRATTTISVASRQGVRGRELVAAALAQVLKDLTGADVLLVEARLARSQDKMVAELLSDDFAVVPAKIARDLTTDASVPAFLKVGVRPDVPRELYGERASNLISKLSSFFSFMVFDLGSDIEGLADEVREFSDVFIEVVDTLDVPLPTPPADGSMKTYRVLNLFNPGARAISISSCEPFVLPNEPLLGTDTATAAAYIRANPRSPAALPIHRLARKLLGSTIGIALGGGAAFGLAHIGVLRVLEQNNIPIDIVAGCSQGSIIAIGYAAGIRTEEMVAIAEQLGRKRNFLIASDPTFFTKPGILAGTRFVEILAPYLRGKETFEDLLLPCKTVATDIETGERVAIGSGRLDTAFRASSSVPMVLSPIKRDDRVLVDGGVADPVPAEVVNEMGADLCIAVNVVPPLKRGVENVLSRIYRQLNLFNPLTYIGQSHDMPNLFDIVMNSMQILQYELGNFKAITADVLINPDLSDFTWIEYYRADELIQRGVEAAERALPAIHKAIDDKLAPFRKPATTTHV